MQPIKNISLNFYNLLIALVVLVFVPSALMCQPVVTVGDMTGCENTETLIPVKIADMENIGAITLYISVDTSVVDYVGLQDVNPAFSTGDFVGGEDRERQLIILTWLSLVPASIDSGLMCNIRVYYKNSSTNFDVLDNSEFAYPDLTLVEGVKYEGGILKALSSISPDPVSQQLIEGNKAVIRLIGSVDGISMQWQEFNGDDTWYNLSDDNTYSGVNEEELTIESVTASMDGSLFRCLMSNDVCSKSTIDSKLLVVPQGIESQKDLLTDPVIIYPNPAGELLNCRLNKNVASGEIRLVNVNGVVLNRFQLTNAGSGEVLTMNVANIQSGVYFVQLYDGKQMISSVRFMRN